MDLNATIEADRNHRQDSGAGTKWCSVVVVTARTAREQGRTWELVGPQAILWRARDREQRSPQAVLRGSPQPFSPTPRPAQPSEPFFLLQACRGDEACSQWQVDLKTAECVYERDGLCLHKPATDSTGQAILIDGTESKPQPTASWESCCARCLEHTTTPPCRAWVWDQASELCHLKSASGEAVPQAGRTAGFAFPPSRSGQEDEALLSQARGLGFSATVANSHIKAVGVGGATAPVAEPPPVVVATNPPGAVSTQSPPPPVATPNPPPPLAVAATPPPPHVAPPPPVAAPPPAPPAAPVAVKKEMSSEEFERLKYQAKAMGGDFESNLNRIIKEGAANSGGQSGGDDPLGGGVVVGQRGVVAPPPVPPPQASPRPEMGLSWMMCPPATEYETPWKRGDMADGFIAAQAAGIEFHDGVAVLSVLGFYHGSTPRWTGGGDHLAVWSVELEKEIWPLLQVTVTPPFQHPPSKRIDATAPGLDVMEDNYGNAFRFNLGRESEMAGREKIEINLFIKRLQLDLKFSICKVRLPKHKLTMCTNALHSYSPGKIVEWLEYHFLLGVDHVYLFDRKGEYKKALQKYVDTGRITYIPWPAYVRGLPIPSQYLGETLLLGLNFDQMGIVNTCLWR